MLVAEGRKGQLECGAAVIVPPAESLNESMKRPIKALRGASGLMNVRGGVLTRHKMEYEEPRYAREEVGLPLLTGSMVGRRVHPDTGFRT